MRNTSNRCLWIYWLCSKQNKKQYPISTIWWKNNDAIILVSDLLSRKSPKPILHLPPDLSLLIHQRIKLPTFLNWANCCKQKNGVAQSRVAYSTNDRYTQLRVQLPVFKPIRPPYKATAAKYINVIEIFKFKMHHIYNVHGKIETLDSLLKQDPKMCGSSIKQ